MKNLKYMIFDPYDCPAEHIETFNRLSEFWRTSWENVWTELNMNKVMAGDELLRHRLMAGLFLDDEPICFQAYSFYNLHIAEVQRHTYFKSLPQLCLALLRQKGHRRIATMEYLVAARDPKIKQSISSPLGTVMIGLACKLLMHNLPVEAIVTITRNNRSVNRTCSEFGAVPLFARLPMNNVEVDFMEFEASKLSEHPDQSVAGAVQDLWRRRLDLSSSIALFKLPVKKENDHDLSHTATEFERAQHA